MLCILCLTSSSTLRLHSSDFGAKNSPPDCFFHAPHPLRLQVPFILSKYKNKRYYTSLNLRMVRMKGLEPPRLSRQILNLVRLPVPPHPHIQFVLICWYFITYITKCQSKGESKSQIYRSSDIIMIHSGQWYYFL